MKFPNGSQRTSAMNACLRCQITNPRYKILENFKPLFSRKRRFASSQNIHYPSRRRPTVEMSVATASPRAQGPTNWVPTPLVDTPMLTKSMAQSHQSRSHSSQPAPAKPVETEFLIIGAGPAGAALACFLASYGISTL